MCPEHCLSTRCVDCQSHAIVNGKLDCNYLNRLGLSQPTVKTFLDTDAVEDPVKLEAIIRDDERRMKELQDELDGLAKLKKAGEKKNGSVS